MTLKSLAEEYAEKTWPSKEDPEHGKLYSLGYLSARDGFIAGFKLAREMAAEIASEWAEFYPEDVFLPLPRWGTEEQKNQDNALVTRASAQMGRHCSSVLARDIRAMGEEHGP